MGNIHPTNLWARNFATEPRQVVKDITRREQILYVTELLRAGDRLRRRSAGVGDASWVRPLFLKGQRLLNADLMPPQRSSQVVAVLIKEALPHIEPECPTSALRSSHPTYQAGPR
jgi:hypothetical protein